MNKSRILLTDKILIGNILIDHQTTWSWDLLWEGPFWHHTICGADLMKRTFCRQTFRRQTLYLITTLHMWTSMYPGYATSTAWAEGNVVVIYNDLAPFSSDKIRAKILDLGYGGARHEPSIT